MKNTKKLIEMSGAISEIIKMNTKSEIENLELKTNKIKVGIIGASGYTGHELVKILFKHPKVELSVLNSEHHASKKVRELYPDFASELAYTNFTIGQINELSLDVIFLALPHTKAMDYVMQFEQLKQPKCRIVDLSADYRFKKLEEYEKVYGVVHKDKKRKAVYGLPELFREKISRSRIVANPGCYATGMILSAYPIQKLAKHIIFDCKTGLSGAGKDSLYAKDSSIIKDNIIAYNIVSHRHKYEVEQFIKTKISFTPHVLNTFRGMMITSHVLLKKRHSAAEIRDRYLEFYKDHVFVKIVDVDEIPDLHAIQNTNNFLIGGFEIDENNQLVIVAVLDNLVKGASGQAVQNMNIMFGFKEQEGLI
ncbi:MAG: N-acetyl-gamma-glutamyl-phosphate reductase [Candidatus Micrarchaeota archaeon]